MVDLTHEQINEMEAGQRVDALIAELVMGWEKRDEPDAEWFLFDNHEKLGDKTIFWEQRHYLRCACASGWFTFRPSTDIAAAWVVVEKLHKLGSSIQLHGVIGAVTETYCCEFVPKHRYNYSCGDTAPLAICRAALKAVTK